MNYRLKHRAKNSKTFRRKYRRKSLTSGLGKKFFNMILKTQYRKESGDKMDLIKILDLCTSNSTIRKMK